MAQGADRPGQPNIGQRSIFGNGGPTFAQMPAYTPVTRPNQPSAPPQPAYPQTASQPQPAHQPPAAAPQAPQAAPSYQPQPHQPQAYGGDQQYQPQAYSASRSAFGDQDLPDLSNADPGFPESIFGDFKADASFPEADFSGHSGAPDHGLGDAGFPEQGDAGFPEHLPTSAHTAYGADSMGHGFLGAEDSNYPAGQNGGETHYDQASQAPQYQPHAYQPQAYAPQAPQQQAPQQAYAPDGQGSQIDPRRQLQAFDSVYDQPPQIALGGQQSPAQPPQQEYYETDRGDADFMDESQLIAPAAKGSKLANSLRGRSAFMVGSALLGAIALGGALAFAYKQSGGGIDGETPIVTADATPVKEAPDQPGGKEFPHKNKLIYDRLTNGNEPESERLVPRQEDVAVPALPPATATAGLPAAVATTDFANPATTQSVDGAAEDGGPRKVKTLVVRPDGSVEAPAVADAANAAAGAAAQAAQTAAGAAAQAAGEPANMMPVPIPDGPVPMAAPAAAPQQMAAADPAPQPAAASKYLVQVGAHKSQTEALANYADIQQKYPTLLGNYPPVVQKASVGGGSMYRLRVGPIASKSDAYKLCGDLKAKGTDCFVAVQ